MELTGSAWIGPSQSSDMIDYSSVVSYAKPEAGKKKNFILTLNFTNKFAEEAAKIIYIIVEPVS